MKSFTVTSTFVILCLTGIICLRATYGLPEEEHKGGTVKEAGHLDVSVNDEFDRIFAEIRQIITENEIDPITLPSDNDNFTATLFNTVLNGYVWVGDGEIGGLSSIHRTGNMSVQLKPIGRKVVVKGHAGFTNLEGKYSSHFQLGPFKSNFEISIKISYVSLGIEADVSIPPSDVNLGQCQIDDLSTLQVKLRGIGLFDSRLYTLLVNALTQLLEPVITAKVEESVCNILQRKINGA